MKTEYPHLLMFVRAVDSISSKPQELWVRILPEQVGGEIAVETDGPNVEARGFDGLRRRVNGARSGAVFAVHLTDKNVQFAKRALPVGIAGTEAQRTRWQAETRAVDAVAASLNRALNEARKDLDREALAPLRDAYQRLGSPQRAQLIADVVRFISTPKERRA